MKLKKQLLITVQCLGLMLLLAFSLQPSALLAQGALTPPGAPAPTMKSLAQIEPRTSISSLPFTISTPGSYYLTTNLTASAGLGGITIAANNVTLDLNGFVLQGLPNAVGPGILIQGSANITIRNGRITGWQEAGLKATANTLGLVVERIQSSYNLYDGLTISSTGFVVRDCTCQGNHGDGIYASGNLGSSAGGTITGCSLVANQYSGLECYYGTVKDCQCLSNVVVGIFTANSQVTGCRIDDCGNTNSPGTSCGISVGQYCDISKCLVQNCVGWGIYLNNNNGGGDCQISDCFVGSTTGSGIYDSVGDCRISNCKVADTGGVGINAFHGTSVRNCQVSHSAGYGIEAFSCTVADCTVAYCLVSGIYVNAPGSQITGNTCLGDNFSGNTSYNAGIYINDANNRVENNHVTASGYAGIAINNGYYSGNIVIRNSVEGNGANNYLGTAGNDVGPIGSAATATSPWANISH